MKPSLTEEQWAEIDALILRKSYIIAIKSLRDWTGIGMREALEGAHERYEQLRRERPDDFVCSDKEYWVGFYS